MSLPTPIRVVVDERCHMTTAELAIADYDITPDIIFMRDDGWSLGAPADLEEHAYALWRGHWAWFQRRDDDGPQPMTKYRPSIVSTIFSLDLPQPSTTEPTSCKIVPIESRSKTAGP